MLLDDAYKGWHRRAPTRYQVLRQMYADDVLTIEQFEQRVALLLRFGRMNEPCSVRPSDWDRPDLTMWPVPPVNDLPERNLALPEDERLALARAYRDEGRAYEPLPKTEMSG